MDKTYQRVECQKPAVLMAVKTANDLGIFSLLSQMTSFATCGELAARNKADISRLILTGTQFTSETIANKNTHDTFYQDAVNVCKMDSL
jgi:hypothetical protein